MTTQIILRAPIPQPSRARTVLVRPYVPPSYGPAIPSRAVWPDLTVFDIRKDGSSSIMVASGLIASAREALTHKFTKIGSVCIGNIAQDQLNRGLINAADAFWHSTFHGASGLRSDYTIPSSAIPSHLLWLCEPGATWLDNPADKKGVTLDDMLRGTYGKVEIIIEGEDEVKDMFKLEKFKTSLRWSTYDDRSLTHDQITNEHLINILKHIKKYPTLYLSTTLTGFSLLAIERGIDPDVHRPDETTSTMEQLHARRDLFRAGKQV